MRTFRDATAVERHLRRGGCTMALVVRSAASLGAELFVVVPRIHAVHERVKSVHEAERRTRPPWAGTPVLVEVFAPRIDWTLGREPLARALLLGPRVFRSSDGDRTAHEVQAMSDLLDGTNAAFWPRERGDFVYGDGGGPGGGWL